MLFDRCMGQPRRVDETEERAGSFNIQHAYPHVKQEPSNNLDWFW